MKKNNSNLMRYIGVVIICCSINSLIKSQETFKGFSINPKFGSYYLNNDFDGFVGGGELNMLNNDVILSIAYYNAEEFVLFTSPSKEYNQLDIIVGKYIGIGYFRLQYQGGVGALWLVKRGALLQRGRGILSTDYYEKKHSFTVGIPLKLGFKFIPFKFISIGFDFQANLNFEKPIFMPMLSIEIGKLRKRINE